MEVKDMLKRLQQLGLQVKPGSNHWKIYHPTTGVWLFDVSKSPSDANWYFNIRRHLKRVGLSLEAKKVKKVYRPGKRHMAVDLVALKKAQDQAAAAGEHIPSLSDLDEAPPGSPLWKRVKMASNVRQLTQDAQEESMQNMAPRANARRTQLSRIRLRKLLEGAHGAALESRARERAPTLPKGRGAKAEFVRIAMEEVAPARGIQAWKSDASGQQSLSSFLKQDDDSPSSLTLWALTLIDATMDHIEGLKWGVYDKPPTELSSEELAGLEAHSPGADVVDAKVLEAIDHPVEEPVEEPTMSEELVMAVEHRPSLKDRYASILLDILERRATSSDEQAVAMTVAIMDRLDKLVLDEDNS